MTYWWELRMADRDALMRAGDPDGAAGMSRDQWDVYMRARLEFRSDVRVRTEQTNRRGVWVFITVPGDVERGTLVVKDGWSDTWSLGELRTAVPWESLVH